VNAALCRKNGIKKALEDSATPFVLNIYIYVVTLSAIEQEFLYGNNVRVKMLCNLAHALLEW
jgi:hypothetical protein